MVAAIMGARARLGYAESRHEDYQADKKAAEKKKKTTITAGSFDRQVSGKLGKYFDATFLPRPSCLRDLCALLCRSNFSPKPPSGPFQITTERSAQKDTAQRSLRFNLELRTPNLQRHPAKSRMGKFLCPNACFVGLGTSPTWSSLEVYVLSSHTWQAQAKAWPRTPLGRDLF